MLGRYDWNNSYEINDEKLYFEFLNSNLYEKIAIYRQLDSTKRIKLRKLWDDDHFKKRRVSFLRRIKTILEPLCEYISIDENVSISEIKNEYEFWIVRGIAQQIGLMPLSTDNAINIKADEKKFNDARKIVIEYLEKFKKREYGYFSQYNKDPLIDELEAIQYKKPVTNKGWEQIERNEHLNMLYAINVGKERAFRIVRGIEKWHEDNNIQDRRELFEIKHILDNQDEQLLSKLSMMDTIYELKLDSKEDRSFLEDMMKQNINKNNYEELLRDLNYKREYLNSIGSIETRKADDFFKSIQNYVLKKLYP